MLYTVLTTKINVLAKINILSIMKYIKWCDRSTQAHPMSIQNRGLNFLITFNF
jgi:hypothetical protein